MRILRTAALIVLSLALFLGAATWHGRRLRMEREHAGYMQVRFGAPDNPAWVEELWHAERVRFWTMTLLFAAGALVSALILRRHYGLFVLAAVFWGPSLSFLVFGVLSMFRIRAIGA
jgi:hypothetical protein